MMKHLCVSGFLLLGFNDDLNYFVWGAAYFLIVDRKFLSPCRFLSIQDPLWKLNNRTLLAL